MVVSKQKSEKPVGVCWVDDLGTVKEKSFSGRSKKIRHRTEVRHRQTTAAQ